ncbi:arylsulfatase [Candidatus Poribacteria bacterium]|nr:arylsulfatase [Candidatus Poribacteria bacterium]
MNRKQFIQSITASSLALSFENRLQAEENPNRKPNIVLIMADDLGWQEIGVMGQKKIRTPNIDNLATKGMRFNQFYSGSAVCAPSRCNLITGKHGGHAYIRNNREIKNKGDIFGGQLPLPEGEIGLAKILKSVGYTTGCFGKWGLGAVGTTGDPLNQGFDRFYGYNCQRHAHNLYPKYLVNDQENELLPGNTRSNTGEIYAPQRIADEMLEFVSKNKKQPFFLYYPTVLPHLPLQAPKEDIEEYKGLWPETPYNGRSYQPHPTPRACYAAMISFLDKQIGRLMALLKNLNLDRNTIVMFTSDNGSTHLRSQVDYDFFDSVGPLRGLKGSLYEGGIRVPFIAHWPGKIRSNQQSDHLAANYDLLATIAEIVDVQITMDTDGTSFLPLLLGKTEDQKIPPYLFWDFAGYGGQMAVRMGKWKGLKRDLRKKDKVTLELYNLEEDIGETNNVTSQHPEIAAKIEQIILRERVMPTTKEFQFGTYADKS